MAESYFSIKKDQVVESAETKDTLVILAFIGNEGLHKVFLPPGKDEQDGAGFEHKTAIGGGSSIESHVASTFLSNEPSTS